MAYYGWCNSVSIVGRLLAPPTEFTSKSNRKMISFRLLVPTYKHYPKREGQISEEQPNYVFDVIGGDGVVKAMKRKKLNTGDIVVINGYLISLEPPKKYAKGDVYIVATNVLCLKGYKGMKYIEYHMDEEATYNEVLKEIRSGLPNGTSKSDG